MLVTSECYYAAITANIGVRKWLDKYKGIWGTAMEEEA
jgi:hypothetical protein